MNDVIVLETSSNLQAIEIAKEKEKRLSDEIVKYLTQNPYEKGGKEVNPSNKDLKIGLNSKCLAIYDML
jgi:hypothetical protein